MLVPLPMVMGALSPPPDAVRLGKVPGLLGLRPGQYQAVNFRVSVGLFLLGLLCPQCVGSFQQVQRQHLVKISQGVKLGGIVGLGFQNIVKGGNGQRCIQVAIKGAGKLFFQLLKGRLVYRSLRIQGGDFGDQLFIGTGCIVQILPGEYQVPAVMALQTEIPVGHGVIALVLQQRNRQEFALRFAHFAV